MTTPLSAKSSSRFNDFRLAVKFSITFFRYFTKRRFINVFSVENVNVTTKFDVFYAKNVETIRRLSNPFPIKRRLLTLISLFHRKTSKICAFRHSIVENIRRFPLNVFRDSLQVLQKNVETMRDSIPKFNKFHLDEKIRRFFSRFVRP